MTIATQQPACGAARRAVPALACVLSLALVFAMDWLTPPAIQFGPYYLIPVALAAWYLGTLPAGAMVLIASVARTFVLGRQLAMDGYAIYAVDFATTLAVSAGTAVIVARVRAALRRLTVDAQGLRDEARRAERRLKLQWSIRRAVESDVDSIIALMVLGAQTGDLARDVLDPARQAVLRTSYIRSIEKGAESRRTWYATDAVVPIEFWVSHLNGKLAGYFMVMALDDKGGSERELHAIVTAAAYRGLGLGSAMVDFFCAHYHGRRQYAACMPDGRMHRMLTQRGFRRYADTHQGYVIVERPEWLRHGEREAGAKAGFVAVGDSILEPA